MKFTNRYSLPQYLVDWLMTDNYDHSQEENTFSATSLMKPIQQMVLSSRYKEYLEMDVSDLIASRYGTAIHDSVEKIQTENVFKENRVSKKIVVEGVEFTVTGKYDILVKDGETYTLRDMKSTSVWSQIYGGKDDDYREQLSIYRWILSDTKTVNPVAYVDFFFTDWQSSKAKTEENYPNSRIHAGHRVELLSLEDTEKFIYERIKRIKDNRDVPDNKLPECSKKELWAKDDSWAVYKINNKRATKVAASEEEAKHYKIENNISGHIQHRPGKVKRCIYCPAASYCSQFKKLREYNLIDD